jgi:hypothetical protein
MAQYELVKIGSERTEDPQTRRVWIRSPPGDAGYSPQTFLLRLSAKRTLHRIVTLKHKNVTGAVFSGDSGIWLIFSVKNILTQHIE